MDGRRTRHNKVAWLEGMHYSHRYINHYNFLYNHQPMTESKIQWEGWHQFTGLAAFLSFAQTNIDQPYNSIIWLTIECPIVVWLN